MVEMVDGLDFDLDLDPLALRLRHTISQPTIKITTNHSNAIDIKS